MPESRSKLLALLIGINQYDPAGKVPPLKGCENDVQQFAQFLYRYNQSLKARKFKELHIHTLSNEAATHQNIIEHFRSHLINQADENSTVVFFYSGHGSYQPTANEFKNVEPDPIKHEETLVTYDSRTGLIWDLADKEVAALLGELEQKKAHILVILDCCHSGSGTRETLHPLVSDYSRFAETNQADTDEEASRAVEMKDLSKKERPLDSYLGGFYTKMFTENGEINIPSSRHLLLSACDKDEHAREIGKGEERQGILTKFLIETLDESIANQKRLTYQELHQKLAEKVKTITKSQNPQYEGFKGFSGQDYFLGQS